MIKKNEKKRREINYWRKKTIRGKEEERIKGVGYKETKRRRRGEN